MNKYDDKFKASAVIMLQGAGYPDNPYKLAETARYLGIPHRTLRRWFENDTGAPAIASVIQEKREITTELRGLLWKFIDGIDADTISEMSGQQLVTSIGIVIDKLQLLANKPTQITDSTNRNLNLDVNVQAEAHDAGNILKQLAELGAIPSNTGQTDNDAASE